MEHHALVRTNEKGQSAISRCVRCGKENLTTKDFFNDPCTGAANMSKTEALLEVLGVDPDEAVEK